MKEKVLDASETKIIGDDKTKKEEVKEDAKDTKGNSGKNRNN